MAAVAVQALARRTDAVTEIGGHLELLRPKQGHLVWLGCLSHSASGLSLCCCCPV